MLPAWIQTYLERRDEAETVRRTGRPVETVAYTAPCEVCGDDCRWSSTLYEIWNQYGHVVDERQESKSHCPCSERNAA